MATAARLVVNLTARTTDFERGLAQLEKALDRSVRQVDRVGKELSAGLTVPLLALTAAATKFSTEWDDSFQRLSSAAGYSAAEVDRLKNGVLQLAGATASKPKELAAALSSIDQAGLKGARGLAALEASAMGAKAGLGSLKAISDVVSVAVASYGEANLNAAKAAGVLMAVQQEGRITAEDMAGVLGKTVPLAAQLGIRFDEVGAALAVMTRSGMDAGQAATALQQVLGLILKPSADAQRALTQIGLSAAELRKILAEGGLQAALAALQARLEGQDEVMTRLFPSMRSLGGVMTLLGGNAAAASATFTKLAKVTSEDLGNAFSKAANDPGFKLERALVAIETVFIRLGDQVLPRLVPFIETFANKVGQLAGALAGMTPGARDLVVLLGGLAIVAGPALVAFASMVHALASIVGVLRLLVPAGLLAGLWAGIVAIAGALATAIGYLTTFGAKVVILELVLPALAAGATALASALWAAVVPMLPWVAGAVAVAGAAYLIYQSWDKLRAGMQEIWRILEQTVIGKMISTVIFLGQKVVEILTPIGSYVKAGFVGAWDFAASGVRGAIDGMQSGMTSGFDAMLLKAEGFATEMMGKLGGLGSSGGPALPDFGAVNDGIRQLPDTIVVAQGAWERFVEKITSLSPKMRGTMDALTALKERMADTGAAMQQQLGAMADGAARNMGALTAEFAKGSMKLGEFVEKMLAEIGKLIAKMLLLQAMTSIGLGGPFAASFIGGLFAEGGRPPMGKVSIVGERGPEFFVPDTAGTIVPMTGGLGGGVSVQIDAPVSITGVDVGDPRIIRRILEAHTEELRSGTVEAVRNAMMAKDVATQKAGRTV